MDSCFTARCAGHTRLTMPVTQNPYSLTSNIGNKNRMGNNQNLGMTEDHGPGRTLFRPRRANLLQGLTLTIADLHPKQQTARKLGPPTDLSGAGNEKPMWATGTNCLIVPLISSHVRPLHEGWGRDDPIVRTKLTGWGLGGHDMVCLRVKGNSRLPSRRVGAVRGADYAKAKVRRTLSVV